MAAQGRPGARWGRPRVPAARPPGRSPAAPGRPRPASPPPAPGGCHAGGPRTRPTPAVRRTRPAGRTPRRRRSSTPGRAPHPAAAAGWLPTPTSRPAGRPCECARERCSYRPPRVRRARSAWHGCRKMTARNRTTWPCPRPLDRGNRSDITAEFGLKRCPLVGPEATNAPRLRNAEPLHDLLGPYLADARHRLEQCRDLHLAYHVICLAILEHLGQRRRAALEAILD